MHLLAVAKNENYNALKKLNCKKKKQSEENTRPIKEKIKNTCSSFNLKIIRNKIM